MYDICPEDKPETYTCPICGREYRLCQEPTCRHSDEEWSEYLDHEEAMMDESFWERLESEDWRDWPGDEDLWLEMSAESAGQEEPQ